MPPRAGVVLVMGYTVLEVGRAQSKATYRLGSHRHGEKRAKEGSLGAPTFKEPVKEAEKRFQPGEETQESQRHGRRNHQQCLGRPRGQEGCAWPPAGHQRPWQWQVQPRGWRWKPGCSGQQSKGESVRGQGQRVHSPCPGSRRVSGGAGASLPGGSVWCRHGGRQSV